MLFSKKKQLTFAEFLLTPAGQYIIKQEERQFRQLASQIFGYHALQISFSQCDFLADCRIGLKCQIVVDTANPPLNTAQSLNKSLHMLIADACHLPIASNSIDLVVLPHQLELTSDPHQLLREIERVLIPEGSLLISGFNPWSWWGLFWLRNNRLATNLISISRLKDWLKLLNFTVDRGYFSAYQPPFQNSKSYEKFASLEKIGDRWFSHAAGVYLLRAVKRKKGMHLIGARKLRKFIPPLLNPAVTQSEVSDKI